MIVTKKGIKNTKKRSIKKPLLVSLFVCYQFLMPFVMSCGVDTPYDKTIQESDTQAASTSDNCDTNEFLTADCVDEVQADEDEAVADDAADETDDTADDTAN